MQLSEYVRRTHSADGGILLDLKHGRMFSLNRVGSTILELVDRRQTEAAIAGEISREFGIDTDVALRDVKEFLDTLVQNHLIDVHSAETAL